MRRLTALAMIVTALVVVAARPAAAVGPTGVGWWWVAQTGTATLPPPPTVPPGGFMVGGDPSGANAIAALRFELDDDQGSPAMTLHVAENGDVNGASAQLAACRVVGAWAPTFAGPWPSRPTADCASAVLGTRSEDGKAWVFNLQPFLVGNIIDIVLTPGQGSNFSLSFNAPTETTLKTAPKPAAPVASAPSPDFAPSVTDDATSAAFVDFGAPLDVPAFTPAPTEDVSLVGPPGSQLASPALAAPKEGRKVSGVAIVLLLGALAVGYALSQAPTPALSGLGPMAAVAAPVSALRRRRATEVHAQEGGLGRFARMRTGPPPKL